MDWLAQGLALRTQKEKLHVCKFKHTLTHIPSHTLTHTHTFTHTHTLTHTHTHILGGRQAGVQPHPPQLSSFLVKLSFTAFPHLFPIPQIALGRQLSPLPGQALWVESEPSKVECKVRHQALRPCLPLSASPFHHLL